MVACAPVRPLTEVTCSENKNATDYKDKYRLIVATPNAPTRAWSEADDDYLRNIVDFVYAQMDKNGVEVKTFWLAGHSQGGQTSNRLLNTNFYGKNVDG